MFEHHYEDPLNNAYSDESDIVEKREKADKNADGANLSPIDEQSDESSDDEDESQQNDYLVWRIYDKIIAAFTSEFVVVNLCRLGLCLWILRYNCVQSIVILIYLFHSTLIKSYIGFLPFIQFLYLPYMFLNLAAFYVLNVVMRAPDDGSQGLSNVKYGIIIFESPAVEFPIMLFCILLSALLAIKISNLSEQLQGKDEGSFQKQKQKTLRNIQKRSSILSVIYYVFYLSIEALLLFILLLNVVSKVNLTNFCLNLYLVVYLIYPGLARRNIRKFLFVIEALNLINYVYGIVIASSDNFFAGELGNLIGIDSYEVHVRKYFNVIPTIRIVALIIVAMAIWNTLPHEADDEYHSDKSDFEARLYKTLYSFSKCFTEFIYVCFNVVRTLAIWICYALILMILVINDHSVKNWVLAVMIAFVIYKHLSTSAQYLVYFRVYAGFVFISTWVYQFLKFDLVKSVLGVTDVDNIPINGDFWGYTVLTEEQLLFRVVALSALLVLSVIADRGSPPDAPLPNFSESRWHDELGQMDDSTLYGYLLRQKEAIFWASTSTFWPVITF